ncbi:GH92 family glycosyl hydrolase [Sinomicrobium weinanense]|uniref:Glycoside hydrolase family 92 protein n=1 Tax=Sinomicrobium weinanense TaxID=2842200 RepID=A0A926JVC3_9FLAO|nr:GH92 family glycosyl hydrolase [Sinomicrobium weinanense]MBC9797841.1 glycoside hydrolase family 92 protein [Sinomicrobium weinanense]MBU3124676.1 GH92 family glycosyl hydrolase [Sinomicrobium weinanense]
MKKKCTSYALLGMLCVLASCGGGEKKENKPQKKEPQALTRYADPFIGTGDHGHTYPGATVPFGMIQLSPDNGTNGWDWCSGYHYTDSIAVGFSHLHLSGTGIGDLADLLFMPVNKEVDLSVPVESRDDYPYKSKYSHTNETATPGYYQVYLEDHDINAELTASRRTGFHRYTYKENDPQAVVIDLGFAINWDKPTDTKITVEDETTISGYRHSTGWAKNQKVFYVAKFSKPIQSKNLYADARIQEGIEEVSGTRTSAQLFFDEKNSDTLEVKLSLSSVSVDNARENMKEREGFNFDKVQEDAAGIWNGALGKIQVETPVDSLKTIFYTALYHTRLAPVTFSDANGQFRLQNDSIVTAANYTAHSTMSLWDTFRAEQPLMTLLDPERVSDIINSMLVYYEENKTLPVWTLYGNETYTMTGNHAIPVITEAILKGIKGFDVNKAYDAMKATMMKDDESRGVKFYKEHGYVPYNLLDESVTITLEFAYDDWCIAQVAKTLGKEDDYDYFSDRSGAFKHLYDPKTGFMRGKSDKGQWHEPFDPKLSIHRKGTDYTEGNAWQHSWFVLHDVDGLIALHGGETPFTAMLEQLFTESSEIKGGDASPDISGLIGQYAHGNEPSHHIAYMFNYAGQPWRTQYWVREIMKTQYDTTPAGLSGNEDCGQMSAWYVFSAMGIYPYNPSSGTYQIGSPLFEKSVIKIADGVAFTIKAENVSDKNIYIQSATLNGAALNRTYITHEEMTNGGELKFVMGPEPNKNWGVDAEK